MRWNPEQCGTSRISVPKKLLWVPDIVINELYVPGGTEQSLLTR